MKKTISFLATLLAFSVAGAWLPTNTTTLSTNGALTLIAAQSTVDSSYARALGGADSAYSSIIASDTILVHQTSGAFVDTITGLNAVVTDSIYWTLNGKDVDLTVLAATGTSNCDSLTILHLPATLRPARIQNPVVSGITDSGTVSVGQAAVNPNGLIRYSVFKTNGSGRAIATATMVTTLVKGVALHKIHYNLK